ncbi:uncharacterized protein CIMG_08077 [Coccidioides immitis RS]|uniref:Uncharacterized protein n=4 Tax=Coccidioides immitis TaxID=5501 RepID=J3K4S0_COCIM|nr:uncharacterized protein CIMG_08077 [Coccidioides immitis RS]KMP06464.1 hypothetical protein CIRG_06145 [Coccidioides immitis RMSCC 2394]KMU80323.1 hypothetical protein CISG_02174 [Coccidioides immitis RMSCC 3703]KMU84039.1 hypothetical protein CIHG_01824 [Coccidioides immitis H538.4]TPX22569.1 hypothetical protein DIZ76_014445 [Coccidioides immitis]EAS29331.3 hypothetical protein CIMG_08077 [Coccidioides immitis RS]
MNRFYVAVVLWTSTATCFSLFNRADGFKVLSSSHGDRFTIGLDVEIRWEAPDTERVKLEVRKGFPQNLTTVHVITQNINNNKWRSRDDAFLRAKGSSSLPVAPLSGCDYVITTRDGQTSARSGYFTIINVHDDGLPPDPVRPNVAPSRRDGGPTRGPGSPNPTGGN